MRLLDIQELAAFFLSYIWHAGQDFGERFSTRLQQSLRQDSTMLRSALVPACLEAASLREPDCLTQCMPSIDAATFSWLATQHKG